MEEILYYCKKCGKPVYEKFGSGKFCSRSCANSHVQTKEINEKRSKTLSQRYLDRHVDRYSICKICGKKFKLPINSYGKWYARATCSDECFSKANSLNGIKGGRISANIQVRRSKNEIYFCELCEKHFKNVRHNEPIFNGWDADVIIDDIKYAVLWNGQWHYRKIRCDQSLEQIQTRDKIKLDQIISCGYTPYIIKDMGRYNKKFVEEQFNLFIDKIGSIA